MKTRATQYDGMLNAPYEPIAVITGYVTFRNTALNAAFIVWVVNCYLLAMQILSTDGQYSAVRLKQQSSLKVHPVAF